MRDEVKKSENGDVLVNVEIILKKKGVRAVKVVTNGPKPIDDVLEMVKQKLRMRKMVHEARGEADV